jgi:hypothetical protein
MSRDYDNRSSMYDGQDDAPADRRGSCRYPVAEVPALLGWWETPESRQAQGSPVVDAEKAHSAVKRPKLFDAETYSAIMARGPALRGGFATAAARPAVRPAGLNRHAASPALAGGKAEPAHAAKPQAGPPALREKAEPRREPSGNGEPQMLSCPARILDISHTGISLVSEFAPPEGQPLWVRLDGLEPSDWIEGTLAGLSRRDADKHLVRIRFTQGCPYDVFKAIVYSGKKA